MNEKQIKTLCTALIDNYAALEAAQVALAERLATARALALDTLNGIRPEVPAGFVDLGLPSGLLWAEKQEEGYYTHEEAVKKYGEALPQPEEFVELWRVCKWDWSKERRGYTVTGPNGNSIFLAASGYRNRASGGLSNVGSGGYYWSAAQYSADYAYGLYFGSGDVYPLDGSNRAYGFSVLPVRRIY